MHKNKMGVWSGFSLVSLIVLYLEVLVTRIFSFVIWHNTAYMVISMTILGLGAGGTWDSIFIENKKRVDPGWLSLVSGAAVLLSYKLLATFDFQWAISGIFYILLSSLLVFSPFFMLGLVLVRIFSEQAAQIGKVYGLNLIASGAGAVLALWVLAPLGMPKALILACLILGAAGYLFAPPRKKLLKTISLLWIIFCASGFLWADHWFKFKVTSTKNLGRLQKIWPDYRLEFSRWDQLGKIDVISSSQSLLKFNDESYFYRDLVNDGAADTPLFDFDAQLDRTKFFEGSLYGQAFVFYDRVPEEVLVIGVGGGPDLQSAIHFQSRKVIGVDVNGTVFYALKKFLPDLALDPRAELVQSDGRNYLYRHRDQFDIIQITGVDTISALQWGAYMQAENYIHTTEGYMQYLNHLAPDGVMALGLPDIYPPRNMLRACVLAVEALRRLGIAHPEDNIIIIQQVFFLQMLVKKESIDQTAIQKFSAQIQAHNFVKPLTYEIGFVKNQVAPMWIRYAPGIGNKKDPFVKFFRAVAEGRESQFIENYIYDITPVSDGRPFFYYFYRPSLSLVPEKFAANLIWIQLLEAISLALIFVLMPLHWLHRKEKTSLIKNVWFFLFIGLGYMLIEIPFIQRFVLYLGHPVYALVLVLVVLLAGSGLGAWLFHAFLRERKWAIWASVITIIVWSLLGLKLMPWLLSKALPAGPPATIMLAAAFTFILGVAMGIPFPAGINALGKNRSNLVPWAWAINTSASVVSSILAVILAMSFGFTVVSALAAAVYLLAGISYHLLSKT